jgi:hypothetical protein
MQRGFGGFIARLHLKRFQAQFDIQALEREGRIFSLFSIVFCSGILVLCAALWLLLLGSSGGVISLLVKWVELFRLREIFKFALFDAVFISRLYRAFIAVVLALVSLQCLLRIMKSFFGVVVLSPGVLIVVESNIVASRIHQIPFDRIFRVSARETILHRVLRLGILEILTGEKTEPFRFGPVPRFPSLVAKLMGAISQK